MQFFLARKEKNFKQLLVTSKKVIEILPLHYHI